MDLHTKAEIKENYDRVQENIQRAALQVGRDPDQIRLVVVTKGHSLPTVQQAVAAGVRLMGENYVEEAHQKMEALRHVDDIEWHMIGHIQSRKANQVIADAYSWVHSVDSLKISKRLSRFAAQAGRILPVLLECNVSGEESKYGFPAWREADWVKIRDVFEEIVALSHLSVRGLMTMPPYFSDPEVARPYFQRLSLLASYLKQEIPYVDWRELSMGMSADYEVAVQEGATLVRVGTAIMGPRPVDQ